VIDVYGPAAHMGGAALVIVVLTVEASAGLPVGGLAAARTVRAWRRPSI
jgi:hypothetical protein